MLPKISVLIPVYRESEQLESLLNALLSDSYENKELIVVIDEATDRSLQIIDKFSSTVNFSCNGARKGKANVLNEVANKTEGKILLFLDSDVLIDANSRSFLHVIHEEMLEADMIEIKKDVINDSFLARIARYDYLGFNSTNWFLSSRTSKCLCLNGAAFAIDKNKFLSLGGFRRVVSEDLDFGIRSFFGDIHFKYVKDISIRTKAPPSWKEWFKQRKRWGIGGALWFKEYFRYILRIIGNYPRILITSLLFFFPSLPFILLNLLTPEELYVKAIYMVLLILSARISTFLLPTAVTSIVISVLKNFFFLIISFGVASSIFYLFAKKLEFSFNLLEFAFFYLVYSPIWFLIIISSIIRAYTKRDDPKIDWKI